MQPKRSLKTKSKRSTGNPKSNRGPRRVKVAKLAPRREPLMLLKAALLFLGQALKFWNNHSK